MQRGTSKASSSNAMGNGDNSDNSGFSLGNNSFGFNFDSEENTSPVNSDSGAKSDEDNSSPQNNGTNVSNRVQNPQQNHQQKHQVQVISVEKESASTEPLAQACPPEPQAPLTQEGAAAAAHAQLTNIANQSVMHASVSASAQEESSGGNMKVTAKSAAGLKRKVSSVSSGYKSDDERTMSETMQSSISVPLSNPTVAMQVTSAEDVLQPHDVKKGPPRGGKKPKQRLDDQKRVERNEREKERSYRITSQINELRNLLSSGGVIVPKGTKNAVLTEAANYIRILQQQQYKSEIHRQQLIQQMQMIGAGQLGPQAANAIRHVAAQNGVWSLGNFGGVPPRSAMSPAGQASDGSATVESQAASNDQHLIKSIEDHDYRFVFNSCVIGMAIASMGGAFIDCNQLFIQLSEYTKQEICGLTIFNLTAKDDLQNAFDLISQMISPPADNNEFAPTCVLRGNMKNRSDLGLNITLIKDEQGIAKCFCVTLIKSPSSRFDDSKPIQATADLIRPPSAQGLDTTAKSSNMSSPAFMTG